MTKIKIKGNLDVFSTTTIEKIDGKKQKWNEILIHGDPKGLKSLAKILLQLAKYDQENDDNLPKGAREHLHLSSKNKLSQSSDTLIIGRLDVKGTGEFYGRYKKIKNIKNCVSVVLANTYNSCLAIWREKCF